MFDTLLLTEEGSYPDGTWNRMAPLPESYGEAGWGGVLDRAAARMAPDGVILLTAGMAARLGLGKRIPNREKPPTETAALKSARAAGWACSKLRSWTTFHGEGADKRPALHVGVLEWMRDDDLPVYDDDPCATALHLHIWRQTFGVPWAGNAAVSGLRLVKATARGRHQKRAGTPAMPKWKLPEDQIQPGWSSAADFRMAPWKSPNPSTEPYAHTYDVNRMWLAAAQVAPLAVDQLTHTRGMPFDPKRAGFWLVRFEPWGRGDILPDPAGARAARAAGDPVWVTTPRLTLVHELAEGKYGQEFAHAGYTLVDSWTAPAWPVLAPWARALREVMDDMDLSDASKLAYSKALTTMSQPERSVYRPDWAAGSVDMGGANLFRKLLAIGRAGGGWPDKVAADQVTFGSVAPDHADDIPAGMEYAPKAFGKFKHWDKCACASSAPRGKEAA